MVDDMSAMKFPSRRPWLAVFILLAVVGALWLRHAPAMHRANAPKTTLAPVAVQTPAATQRVAVVAAPPATNATASATTNATAAVVPPPQAGGGSTAAVTNIDLWMAACTNLEAQGRLVDARTNYLAMLKESLSEDARKEAEQRVAKVNIMLVSTPMLMPEKEDYVVAPGDSMDRIAKKFGTTVLLIQKSNERTNSLIKAGDRLRVFKGRFEVAVSKSRNELLLTMNGEFFKRYGAGTGRYGKTPVGTFVVSDKLVQPVWWRPDGKEIPFGDPENILGTRWMALRATGTTLPVKGYGIHGTWDDASIGKAESAGCVRLRNPDVEELFDLLPMGTAVTISE